MSNISDNTFNTPAPLFHGDLVNTSRIIYTPSNFAKQSLLHIQEIGTLTARKPHVSSRENLDSFLFLAVLSGSGTLTYNGRTYALSPGDCAFIDCKRSYSHETSGDLWTLSWIHFNGPTAVNIYEKYLERGGLTVFHPEGFERYTYVCDMLHRIASEESYIRDMKINSGLAELVTLLMEDSWHPESLRPDTKKTNLAQIKSFLDENYAQKITLDSLSQRYFINKYYLTRIFKEQYGVSINNYLLSVRITHAKSLLRFSDMKLDTIGLECGIGSGYYFSRIFRSVEGMSPGEYRKQWRSGK